MYAGSGIWKTIPKTTTIVQFNAMRATAAPLPGVGRSSSRSHVVSPGELRAGYASVDAGMTDSHRYGGSDPRQLRRRVVESHPHREALRDHDPIERPTDDRQSG